FGGAALDKFGLQTPEAVETLQTAETMCPMRHNYMQTIRETFGHGVSVCRPRYRIPLPGQDQNRGIALRRLAVAVRHSRARPQRAVLSLLTQTVVSQKSIRR